MVSNRFILREIRSEDIHYIHKGLSNPAVTQFYDVHFSTLKDTELQMEWYANLKETGTGIWWLIFDIQTGVFVGAGGYNSLEKTHQKAELSFWLLPEFWGKGIMGEVMPIMINYGFEDLSLNRLEAYVVKGNLKCKSALSKLNFIYEGTMRECELKDDHYISVDFYSMLKKEWIK